MCGFQSLVGRVADSTRKNNGDYPAGESSARIRQNVFRPKTRSAGPGPNAFTSVSVESSCDGPTASPVPASSRTPELFRTCAVRSCRGLRFYFANESVRRATSRRDFFHTTRARRTDEKTAAAANVITRRRGGSRFVVHAAPDSSL